MKKCLPGITTAWVLMFTYSTLFILLVISRNQQFWKQREASSTLVEIISGANVRQSVLTDLYKDEILQEIIVLKLSYTYPYNKNGQDVKTIISQVKSDDSLLVISEKLIAGNKELLLFNQLKAKTATKKRYLDKLFQQIEEGKYEELKKNYEEDLSPIYKDLQLLNSRLLYSVISNDQKLINDTGLKIIQINNENVWISLGLIILLISLGFNLIIIGKKGQRTTFALKESEKKYRTLIEQTNEIIEKCDANGRFVFANDSFKKRFEYNDKELSELTIADVLDEGKIELDKDASNQNLLTNVQKVFKSKSGKKIYLEGTIYLEYTKGIFGGSMGFFNDVTEKKKLEGSLVTSRKRFINILELDRTPVCIVLAESN